MKKFLTFSCLLLASSLTFAGYDDIKPGEKKAAAPTSVEWENANDKALAAATADEVLAAFVRNEASAKALPHMAESRQRSSTRNTADVWR